MAIQEAHDSGPGTDIQDNGITPNIVQAELEALRARNQALEDDNRSLAAKVAAETSSFEKASGDDLLDAMSDLQLKDFITTNTGSRPLGNPKRGTLLRMAMDARPKRAGEAA